MPTPAEIASVTLQFLNRVQLTGAEVPTLVTISDTLRKIAEGELIVMTKEAHVALRERAYPQKPVLE